MGVVWERDIRKGEWTGGGGSGDWVGVNNWQRW